MKKCPDCGNECNDDAKFCDDCGYAFPQSKECPQCHAELKLTARFCSECGYRFQAQAAEAKGSFMGDTNVISGDVAGGNLDRRQFYGNVTSNSNTSNVITNTTATTTAGNPNQYW